jgi:hypothetical protein
MRVHLGPFTRDASDNPTHLLCIAQRGREWSDKYKAIAAKELRGIAPTSETAFVATGFLILEKDMEVVFDIPVGMCFVAGKDFGQGPAFSHPMKKGKYSILLHHQYGKGLPQFQIAGAGGETVLFHTGEILSRELNRYAKVGGRSFKSKLMEAPPEPSSATPAAKADATPIATKPPEPSTAVTPPGATTPPARPAPTAKPDPYATRIPATPAPAAPAVVPSTAPLEQRLIGTKWSFPMSDKPEVDQWVGFAPSGKLLVGWSPGADRPWKMVEPDTAEIRPMRYQGAVYRIKF